MVLSSFPTILELLNCVIFYVGSHDWGTGSRLSSAVLFVYSDGHALGYLRVFNVVSTAGGAQGVCDV